jgi:cyclic dehypoxanthinyl futalosine synthase
LANYLRFKHNPEPKVGWIIDRNVNYTNVCNSGCQFCNFYVGKKSKKAYITTPEEYDSKIKELFSLGGDQLLLQGGLHPDLGLDFYVELFSTLKSKYPNLKLHALGPPEIKHIAELEQAPYKEVLEKLIEAGLDSLPGAGAEILVDRVRTEISKNKCTTQQWLDVMRDAHKLGLTTSATMMFGHVDKPEERIEHLIKIREVQAEKPDGAVGFLSFIPWPFQSDGTVLEKKLKKDFAISGQEYLRLIAISRIMLNNIKNIQASWLTVGKQVGQLSLHCGANDFGSIMIEENVVSVAGADHSFDAIGIQKAIKEAGFKPFRRTQQFTAFEDSVKAV